MEKFVKNECSKTESGKVADYFETARSNGHITSVERTLRLSDERPFLKKERADKIYNNIISK